MEHERLIHQRLTNLSEEIIGIRNLCPTENSLRTELDMLYEDLYKIIRNFNDGVYLEEEEEKEKEEMD